MNVLNLEEFEKDWEEVKELFGYPVLRQPILTNKDIGTAFINMETKDIFISKKFLKKLSEYMSVNDAYKAVAAHEVAHHTLCPYDIKTMMAIDFEITKILGKPSDLSNWFMDVYVNLDVVEKSMNINKVYWMNEQDTSFEVTIKELYTKKTGLYFGQKNYEKINEEKLKQAVKIDYKNTDLEFLKKNARKFAEIFSNIYQEEKTMTYLTDFTKYSDISVDNAFKELSKQLSPEEFSDALIYAKKKNIDKKISTKTLLDYYHNIAKKYFLKISTEKETKIKEENFLVEWGGEESNSINVFRSNAKFIPGVSLYSKKYFVDEEESNTRCATPDALIMIDSSGSMDDPARLLSNAVLAGFIISDFYLKKKKRVAVMNFSIVSNVKNYTFNRKEIYSSILQYQGNFTSLDMFALKKLIKEDLDIYLISDDMICNYQDFENYVTSCSQIKNVSLIAIGSSKNIHASKIKKYDVKSKEDFVKFATKDVRKKSEVYY